jgi:hypothetical protein
LKRGLSVMRDMLQCLKEADEPRHCGLHEVAMWKQVACAAPVVGHDS